MSVYVVVVIAMLVIAGYKASKVLLSLTALELGAQPLAIGVMISLYSLFPLVLAVPAGKVIDRAGFFWPFLVGTSGFVLGLLVPGLWHTLPALYVSAAVTGVGFAFFSVTVQSLVGALGTRDSRTRDFAIFGYGPALGSFFGPLGAGISIDLYGHAVGYLLMSLIPAIGLVVIAGCRRRLPRPAAPAKPGAAGGAFGLWRDPALRQMFLVSGIIVTALELFTFYMPIHGHSIGLSATAIGTVLAGYALAAFVARIFLPGLSRRWGEARLLTAAILMSGAIFLLFPFFRDPWVLALVAFVLGLGLGCCQPLAITMTYNCSPAGRIGEVLGMRISVNKLSEFICPLLFGWIGSAFGVTPVFATIALLLGGGGWLNRRKDGS